MTLVAGGKQQSSVGCSTASLPHHGLSRSRVCFLFPARFSPYPLKHLISVRYLNTFLEAGQAPWLGSLLTLAAFLWTAGAVPGAEPLVGPCWRWGRVGTEEDCRDRSSSSIYLKPWRSQIGSGQSWGCILFSRFDLAPSWKVCSRCTLCWWKLG